MCSPVSLQTPWFIVNLALIIMYYTFSLIEVSKKYVEITYTFVDVSKIVDAFAGYNAQHNWN